MNSTTLADQNDRADQARSLDGEEIASYHDNGFLKIDRLISTEFAGELLDSAKRKLKAWEDANGDDFNGRKEGFRKALWDNVPEITQDDGALGVFSRSKSIATVHAQLLAFPRPVRHFYSQLLIKRPAKMQGIRTPWHQDFPYASIDRTDRPALWIALTDMPAKRGTLRFLKGSHRAGSFGRMLNQPDQDLNTKYPALFERHEVSAPFDLKAGDATVHHPLTIHSAPENNTDEPRWTFLSQFIAADALFTGARPYVRQEFADLTPGETFDHPDYPIIATDISWASGR